MASMPLPLRPVIAFWFKYGRKSYLLVNSDGLAVKHPALGANGDRFDPNKRSKLFQR